MNRNEGWSAASVRVIRQGADELRIPASLCEFGTFNAKRTVWLFESALSSDSPLAWHLREVETFLSRHADEIGGLAREAVVELFLGWTPAPNEKLSFSDSLVALLATARASIVFDLYLDVDDE